MLFIQNTDYLKKSYFDFVLRYAARNLLKHRYWIKGVRRRHYLTTSFTAAVKMPLPIEKSSLGVEIEIFVTNVNKSTKQLLILCLKVASIKDLSKLVGVLVQFCEEFGLSISCHFDLGQKRTIIWSRLKRSEVKRS